MRIGQKVKWFDSSINDYPIEERETQRNRVYYTSSGQHEIAFKLYSLSIDEGWSTACQFKLCCSR